MLAASLALASGVGSAQEPGPVTPNGELVERYEAVARISGSIVAGLMLDGTRAAKRPSLSARLPADWAGQAICVALVSDDGRYEATQEYAVAANWRGGEAVVPLQSRHAGILADTTGETLGAIVRKGDCRDDGTEYAAARWNDEISRDLMPGRLLVNSFRADDVYLVIVADGTEITCRPVTAVNRLAFDFACTLPESLLHGDGLRTVEINRVRDGQFDPPVVISIARIGGAM